MSVDLPWWCCPDGKETPKSKADKHIKNLSYSDDEETVELVNTKKQL